MKQLKLKPSMRDVVALAKAATVDKVSGYNFRSDEEILVFVKQLEDQLKELKNTQQNLEKQFSSLALETAVKVNREGGPSTLFDTIPDGGSHNVGPIKIGNMSKLKDNFSLVTQLSDKLDILDTLEVQSQHALKGDKDGKKVFDTIKAARIAYEKQLQKAMDFLKKIASDHEPKKFKEILSNIVGYFTNGFKNRYSKVDQHVFVTTRVEKTGPDTGQQVLVFNHYVEFKDLVNDHTEYTYPTYVIVFTAVVSPSGKMRMFVNTFHKFRAPGTFKFGHEFTGLKDGVNALSSLFETDDFVDLLDRQALPLKDNKVDLTRFQSKDLIKETEVNPETHKLTLWFNNKVNKENLLQIIPKVLLDVRGMFSIRTQGNLKYKPVRKANTHGLEVILALPTNLEGKKFLTRDKLDTLREHLGLDDDDVHKIIQLFNKG